MSLGHRGIEPHLARDRRDGYCAALFSENGNDHELMCSLPSRGSRARRVVFFRSRGPDFTPDERAIMTLLRPHLVDIYARQSAAAVLGLLTRRQVEIAELLAEGRSNGEIAAILSLSALTVRKHLENIYARLEVTSRTAAVARLYPRA